MTSLRTLIVAVTGLALLLGSASLAAADVVPAGTDNQTFSKSAGGWTSDATYAGLCIPAVTCAVVDNTHQGSGGAGGEADGYLAVGFGSLLSAVEGTSTGIWQSPEFVYRGASGAAPAAVRFDMAVRPNLGALLSVGNTSSYRVDLVDPSGNQVNVVPTTNLSAGTAWTRLTTSVQPSALTIGQKYKVQITSSLVSSVGILNIGEIGYDDVALTTVPKPAAAGGTKPGAVAGTAMTAKQLAKVTTSQVVPRVVKVKNGKVTFTLKCPKAAKPMTCKINVRGLSKGKNSQAATSAKTVAIKPGKTKKVTLKVKTRWTKKYKKAKTASIKTIIKVGKVKTTVHKNVRLRK